MIDRITVITPSIPGREGMLLDAVRSVNAQTVRPYAHLIRCQTPVGGQNLAHIAEQLNALQAGVSTEWLACLHDDDLYLPHHMETIQPYLDDADVIYTFCTTIPGLIDVSDWDAERLAEKIAVENIIPSNAAIRTQIVKDIGGWGLTSKPWEDWDMWLRLARAGARFRCVPTQTWTYRHHEGQTG